MNVRFRKIKEGDRMKGKQIQNRKALGYVALIALTACLPVIFSGFPYGILICCFIMIYVIAVSGLDVVFGYCGQISMGHAAFFAIGAYGSALLHGYFGIPVLLTMLAGALLAAVIGALLAYPASKLVFHFLSLATLAFGEIVYQFISHSPGNITNNFVGYYTESISLFGFPLNTNQRFFYFALVCTVIFLVAKNRIIDSKVGRAFIAVRESRNAADGMGIHVRKYKVTAFSISAFYTAFAGGMYAHLVKYISPDTFMQKQSVMFLTMLLFGGTASTFGPVCGAVIVMLLNELLRSAERYQMLIYGTMLLIVIVMIPGGIYGTAEQKVKAYLKKRKRGEV